MIKSNTSSIQSGAQASNIGASTPGAGGSAVRSTFLSVLAKLKERPLAVLPPSSQAGGARRSLAQQVSRDTAFSSV